MKIAGNVYAITGGATGIGLACAKALISEGARVVLIGRNEKRLNKVCQELGAYALPLVQDITQYSELDTLLERILALTDGKLYGFIANAGLYVAGMFEEGDPDVWDRVINLNVNATFRSIKAVLPHFIAQKGGDILITGSIAGVKALSWEPIYVASKHAVHAFVHALRCQLVRHSIRVSVTAPAAIITPMLDDWPQERVKAALEKGSLIAAEEVAEAVVFMLSRSPEVTIRDLTILPSCSEF